MASDLPQAVFNDRLHDEFRIYFFRCSLL